MLARLTVCEKCGGSGKDPPGRPEVYCDPWTMAIVFVGWTWTMSSTAAIPDCEPCRGTGRGDQ